MTGSTNLDLTVQRTLLVIELLVVVREHLEVVERELLLDTLLERLALLDGQSIGLGNYRHNIDHVGQLLQNNDINGLQRVAGRLDEKKAAVNASVRNITLSLGCEFLSQVCGMLILDILDDGIPAPVVVYEVTVSGRVDNVQSQPNTILFDNMRGGLDLSGRADRLVGLKATLGVNQMRGEDGVDQG